MEKKVKQLFQVGDTAYFMDKDYKFYEEVIYRVELNRHNKITYETLCHDFTIDDIDKWVFQSSELRLHFLNIPF